MQDTSGGFSRVLADRYSIEREIGRGGMATVYLARDLRHNRSVALKVLRADLVGAVSQERFLREIRLTANLHHPHVLTLHDSGVIADVPFYVMPFVDGESLRARLEREPPMPVADARRITKQIASALTYAHQRGVIHRDIKPGNILLQGDHAYLADFGIARAVEHDAASGLTTGSLVVGTPGYMSPEQLAGRRELDGRSDQYALACVLHEMLTGVTPASSKSDGRSPIRQAPPYVARALSRALAAAPVDRFPDVAAFAAALDRPGVGMDATDWLKRMSRTSAVRAVAIACALLVALLSVRPRVIARDASSTAPLGPSDDFDPRRIAVLYFDDHSEQHDLGYLASGLTESLIHELSDVDAIHVISRNGVKPFRDRPVSLDTIGARLRVGSVVEGSIQRSRDRIRVNVQLIDVRSGTQLASRTIERPKQELFQLEDDVARDVATLLRQRLGAQVRSRQAQSGTTSMRARALYLMADKTREDALGVAHSPDSLATIAVRGMLWRADSLFAQASVADPSWVHPRVGRAWVAADLANLTDRAAKLAILGRGLKLAEQAVQVAPTDASALEVRGTIEWLTAYELHETAEDSSALIRAEHDLRAAVAADSTLSSAWSTLSKLLRLRGVFREADADARRALAEDAYLADAPTLLPQLYQSALMNGDYDSAGHWCTTGRRQFPESYVFVECALTLLREDKGRRPDPVQAWALVDTLDRLDPDKKARADGRSYQPIYRRVVAATISAEAGQVDSARAVFARARQMVQSDSELSVDLDYDEAYLRLVLGDRAGALRLLGAFVHANPLFGPFIARDRLFIALWGDSSFQQMLGKAGSAVPHPT